MLSEALRLIRVFSDLKQKEVAKKLGLSKSYISEIESGLKTPTIDVIEKYSQAFEIPISSIIFFSEQLSKKTTEKEYEKARGFIAEKVIDFLKVVERKTA